MTESHEPCDGYATWDGAYVLGALARDDRREYEEHLTGCESCRTAVSKLAGLPGLLALVDPDTAVSVAAQEDPPSTVPPPPERLLPALMAQAAASRRRRRWWSIGGPVLAAAAAVMIAVPVTMSLARDEGPALVQQVVAQGPLKPQTDTPIQATFKVMSINGQTRVDMWCEYPPSDEKDEVYLWTLALWVTRDDGVQSKLAEWTVKSGQTLTLDGTASARPEQLKTVEIRNMSGKVLLAAGL
ncbi:zf-HC2 domain-containing protein [Nocardia aurantiaca]|uniref:Zf-HC2 domain-containing protein n=1 Tax=Nocardia aurantiaca TaxID=2675850 RepID=A0A6I3L2F6_9NOCA|nr:zf-HC2 domain-containing protein [Nocardia aurantiaca]MTE14726.1 zf-HC2 domain-containing protein [Nocardia aurantiaca]